MKLDPAYLHNILHILSTVLTPPGSHSIHCLTPHLRTVCLVPTLPCVPGQVESVLIFPDLAITRLQSLLHRESLRRVQLLFIPFRQLAELEICIITSDSSGDLNILSKEKMCILIRNVIIRPLPVSEAPSSRLESEDFCTEPAERKFHHRQCVEM